MNPDSAAPRHDPPTTSADTPVLVEDVKKALEVDKLREEIRSLRRPPYTLPSFWFGALTTLLAVVGVVAQGVFTSIKSERADLKVEQAQRKVDQAKQEEDLIRSRLTQAVKERDAIAGELKILQATRDSVSNDISLLIVRRESLAGAAPGLGGFDITVVFNEGLTPTQQSIARAAAARWQQIIVGDLPDVTVNGQAIDDVLLEVSATDIDGVGGILGQAGPTNLRPASAGAAAYLPVRGLLSFDRADLAAMEKDGTMKAVLLHEMAHALGFGTVWAQKKLIRGAGSNEPVFIGAHAEREYATLLGAKVARPVPLENTGSPGTRESGWRESAFHDELMTEFLAGEGNVISRLTVAAFEDLGYTVNYAAADAYTLAKGK